MKEELSRLALIAGEDKVNKLQNAKVAVFGLGGVGGAVIEALARSGIGSFVLVDNDTVAKSNINRQIIALSDNIGQKKTQAAKERILKINPDANITLFDCFYLPGNEDNIIDGCDFVVDAIDTVSGKIELIKDAKEKNIPIISCMGTGNKFDPSKLKITDISKTSVCPLCRVMRRELKNRNISKVTVLWSDEEPTKPKYEVGEKTPPGSFMPVTATAGLMIAGHVILKLMEK